MARKVKRDEDISKKVDRAKLLDLYKDVEKGFENQRDRSDEILDNWDMYNCVLGPKQFYNGTSQVALPFVHDAVEARVTRFANQVFPQSGRYVEVTTGEADPPQSTQALIETYCRKTQLRTVVVPALIRNGDVEGQLSIYVTWDKTERLVTGRTMTQPTTDGLPNEAVEPVEDVQEEEITDSFPDVEVISDPDLVVLPATSKDIPSALKYGGSATVLRRWSKGKIKALIDDGDINGDEGETLIEEMTKQRASKDYDVAKSQLCSAGIKDRGKTALVYETWTMLKVNKERRLCRVYFGGEDIVLGAKLNPFWNDRCPVISAPVIKVTGAFKGKAPVSYVADLQIFANDIINEAADSSHFSMMPIVMTDPLANPRVDTMSLALAAVWEVDPNKTQIVTFPSLWSDGMERANAVKDQIFQTLGVNPSMIPQSSGGPAKKRSQAELATEQQVDILTTADAVTNLEESVLTPLVQRYAEYDHQFRDEAITVKVYGPIGEQINMEMVEPIQLGERFEFRWFGVEAARNAAQMQQQISWLNVVKEIPPAMYPDYTFDVAPMLMSGTETTFGPRLAPLTFKKKKLISADPMVENDMMHNGFDPPVNPSDDDQEHIQVHVQGMQEGDPHQKFQTHIAKHMAQIQLKMQQQAAQGQMAGGGPPPGGGAPQGGGPKPGGQVAPPRQGKAPPGGVHPDQQASHGVVAMPRRTG